MYTTDYICQDIATKLKSPEEVSAFIKRSIQSGDFAGDRWLDGTFAEGIPGIVTFFALMDHHYQNEGWDEALHTWLKIAVENLETEGYHNLSLFNGLAGPCFATYLSSQKGNRYSDLLEKLETRLLEEVDHSWSLPLMKSCQKGEPLLPSYYNLMDGIAGVIGYLLLRKDDARIERTLKNVVEQLCQALLPTVTYQAQKVASWLHQDGHFILTMPYGITGALAALSLAKREGIQTESLTETIITLSRWLQDNHSSLQWPPLLSLEAANKEKEIQIPLNKDLWAFGAPIVARTLYLAALALDDEALKNFAQEAYLQVFSRSEKDWNQMASTFAMGKAGVLATTFFMQKELKLDLLQEKIAFFEESIKNFYSPSHHFGFRLVDVTEQGQYRWLDHPGLLEGATGVALSLLLLKSDSNLPWERAFLLN